LIAQKSALVAALNSARAQSESDAAAKGTRSRTHSSENFERFRRMQELNRRLAEKAAPLAQRVSDELAQIRRRLATHSLLHDREFAFSLYPEDKLRRLMGSLWG
jgi:phage shock protein A